MVPAAVGALELPSQQQQQLLAWLQHSAATQAVTPGTGRQAGASECLPVLHPGQWHVPHPPSHPPARHLPPPPTTPTQPRQYLAHTAGASLSLLSEVKDNTHHYLSVIAEAADSQLATLTTTGVVRADVYDNLQENVSRVEGCGVWGCRGGPV